MLKFIILYFQPNNLFGKWEMSGEKKKQFVCLNFEHNVKNHPLQLHHLLQKQILAISLRTSSF